MGSVGESIALSPNDYSPIDSLRQCIDEMNSWMHQNFLQLNKEKTEAIAFGNKDAVLNENALLYWLLKKVIWSRNLRCT